MELISILLLVGATLSMLCMLALSVPGVKRLRRLANEQKETDHTMPLTPEKCPSVTVVVYDFARTEDIEPYLESLCGQTWSNYSIVIVSDLTAAEAMALRERFGNRYSNVHFTFIPPGSHNLSRRKLAFTIGIKAAKSDYVLTTVSNCHISSERWLELMMRPVTENPSKQICMGLSRPDFTQMKKHFPRFKEFDFTVRTLQWMSAAIAGRAVRSDGFNLLFKRSLFFDHNGYASSAFLNPGDDDLFITEIATPTNTAVQIAPETILIQDWKDAANKAFIENKDRNNFTIRFLPSKPFVKTTAIFVTQWLTPLLATGAILTAGPEWLPIMAIGIGIIVLLWLADILLYRTVASTIRSTPLIWQTVPFMLWRIPSNLKFRFRHRSTRHLHFTWHRL